MKLKSKNTRRVFPKIKVILFLFSISIISSTCTPQFEEVEIERLTSPDRVVDAVVTRINPGATASFHYKVYIVPVGANIGNRTPKVEADKVINDDGQYGFTLEWQDVKLLQIKYRSARIYHFSNFWLSKEVQNYNYIVTIQLNPNPISDIAVNTKK